MQPFVSDLTGITPQQRRQAALMVLQAFAASRKVNFVFQGPPRTDGTTIWVGDIDPSDPDFFPLVLGSGIHELMHVRETDMECLRGVAVTRLAACLLNVLEDVRIDAIAMKHTLPYRIWRNVLTQKLKQRGMLLAASSAPMPRELSLAAWVHAVLSLELQMDWAVEFEPVLRKKVHRIAGVAGMRHLQTLCRKVHGCSNTKEVLHLAMEIEKEARKLGF